MGGGERGVEAKSWTPSRYPTWICPWVYMVGGGG